MLLERTTAFTVIMQPYVCSYVCASAVAKEVPVDHEFLQKVHIAPGLVCEDSLILKLGPRR